MNYCPKCGKPVNPNARFCESCGAELSEKVEAEVIYDATGEEASSEPKKGYEAEISEDAKRFVHPSNDPNSSNASPRSRTAAALLCFFLGGFGAHEFYVGKIGAGIVMAIFFWTLIPSIIAFIQFILILCGAFNDVDGKPLLLW